jgi:probable rRNA maturation factor
MNSIEVSCSGVDEPSWLGRLASFGELVLEDLGIDGWEVSLLLCDDRSIAELNSRYRGKEGPTDVLSFPQGEFGTAVSERRTLKPAGDVVISLETVETQAREYQESEEEELKRLLVHGFLHLRGMTHTEGNSNMIELQERILRSLQKERIF